MAAGIPIIDQVFEFGGKVIDKIWMDKGDKEKLEFSRDELKNQFQTYGLGIAFQQFKLLLQDIQGAREVFIAELKAEGVPKWARAIQVLARQYALYGVVSLYIYSKVSTHLGLLLGWIFDKEISLPPITLSSEDYWLIGTVFVFLFGARTVEKITGKDRN